MKPYLTSFGTQKMFSDSYSSRSSSKPEPSSISASNFVSNLSDIYFRKMSPSTTCLYSLAFMLPLNLSAALQIQYFLFSQSYFSFQIFNSYDHQKLQIFHLQRLLVLVRYLPNQVRLRNSEPMLRPFCVEQVHAVLFQVVLQ